MVQQFVRFQPFLGVLPDQGLDEVPCSEAYVLRVYNLVLVHIQDLLHRYLPLFVFERNLVGQ